MTPSFNNNVLFPIENKAFFNEIEHEITSALRSAKKNIYMCMAWLSDEIYGDLLRDLSLKKVRIIIVLDDNNSNKKHSISMDKDNYPYIEVISIKNKSYIMHNKFCIIDNKKIITGSYNYTKNARNHMENIVITENDFDLIISFIKEFFYIKNFYSYDKNPVKKSLKQCIKTELINKYDAEIKNEGRDKIRQELKETLQFNINKICNDKDATAFNLAIIGPEISNDKQDCPVNVYKICNKCFYAIKLLPDVEFYDFLRLSHFDEYEYLDPKEKHNKKYDEYLVNKISYIERQSALLTKLSKDNSFDIHAVGFASIYESIKGYPPKPEDIKIAFIRRGHQDYIPNELFVDNGDIKEIIYSVNGYY